MPCKRHSGSATPSPNTLWTLLNPHPSIPCGPRRHSALFSPANMSPRHARHSQRGTKRNGMVHPPVTFGGHPAQLDLHLLGYPKHVPPNCHLPTFVLEDQIAFRWSERPVVWLYRPKWPASFTPMRIGYSSVVCCDSAIPELNSPVYLPTAAPHIPSGTVRHRHTSGILVAGP